MTRDVRRVAPRVGGPRRPRGRGGGHAAYLGGVRAGAARGGMCPAGSPRPPAGISPAARSTNHPEPDRRNSIPVGDQSKPVSARVGVVIPVAPAVRADPRRSTNEPELPLPARSPSSASPWGRPAAHPREATPPGSRSRRRYSPAPVSADSERYGPHHLAAVRVAVVVGAWCRSPITPSRPPPRAPGQVPLGVHLGHVGPGVAEEHLGGLQAVAPPDLGREQVPELVRVPVRHPGLLAAPSDAPCVRRAGGTPPGSRFGFVLPPVHLGRRDLLFRAARMAAYRSSRSRAGLNTGPSGSITHPPKSTTGRARSRSSAASACRPGGLRRRRPPPVGPSGGSRSNAAASPGGGESARRGRRGAPPAPFGPRGTTRPCRGTASCARARAVQPDRRPDRSISVGRAGRPRPAASRQPLELDHRPGGGGRNGRAAATCSSGTGRTGSVSRAADRPP